MGDVVDDIIALLDMVHMQIVRLVLIFFNDILIQTHSFFTNKVSKFDLIL